jgi:hypothetical protein
MALPLWWRDPKNSYLIVRMTRAASVSVPHVMYATSIAGVLVRESKPLRSLRGLPWWRVILFSLFFPYRIRVGVGEERTRCKFPNPRQSLRYERKAHYQTYLSKRRRS